MRHIAIDLGARRTGVAVGDSVTKTVSPLEVVEVPVQLGGGLALIEALARIVESHVGMPRPGSPHAGVLVVGLPINMDGTEGQQARTVRAFAARLGARCALPVEFQDERLTSVDADWAMARTGMTHKRKKERRDALAAAAILRDYFARTLADGPGSGEG